METLEAIRTRRSVRKFLDRPVEPENLQAVLEAARMAPSWANMQCWRFVQDAGKAGPQRKPLEEIVFHEKWKGSGGARG